MTEPTIRDLMATATGGERGLLAHELLTLQGRRHGPKEPVCDTCGYEWKGSFDLDWSTLEWQCRPCSLSAMLDARGEVPSDVDGNDLYR